MQAHWDAQATALLLNAFARTRMRDQELFNLFAEVLCFGGGLQLRLLVFGARVRVEGRGRRLKRVKGEG